MGGCVPPPSPECSIRCALAGSVASYLPVRCLGFYARSPSGTSQSRLHSVKCFVLGFSPVSESLITLAFVCFHKKKKKGRGDNVIRETVFVVRQGQMAAILQHTPGCLDNASYLFLYCISGSGN